MIRKLYAKWIAWRIKCLCVKRQKLYGESCEYIELYKESINGYGMLRPSFWKNLAYSKKLDHLTICRKVIRLEKKLRNLK